MATATKLVQGKEFDSHTPLSDVLDEDHELAAEGIHLEKNELLHNVADTSEYKIGQEVQIDFDGDDFLKWNGEVTGIFKSDLLVYLY